MKGAAMKSNKEIRLESLSRVLTGKWFGRIFLVSTLLGLVNNLANEIVLRVFKECEIQTWFDYLEVKIQSLVNGVDCSVPSRAIAMQMNNATLFSLFIAFIFGGIALFGITAVVLKSAKQEEGAWFKDSFAGFARPLGLAWLGFAVMVRIALWSVLLVVPGIVASYRYSQCWNLKVEHPDWSASRCLAESCRIMEGHKFQRFRLDFSFLLAVATVMLVAVAIISWVRIHVIVSLVTLLATAILIILGMWMSVARAVFYKAL